MRQREREQLGREVRERKRSRTRELEKNGRELTKEKMKCFIQATG